MNQLRIMLIIGIANVLAVFAISYSLQQRTVKSPAILSDVVSQATTSTNPDSNTQQSTPPSSTATTKPAAGTKQTLGAKTTAPTATQTPPPAPAPTPAKPTCIVTISGKRYDVQPLRSTHPGGDVFTCGTDMTSVFFGQHDQNLLDTQMKQYLLP
jgi:cytochrome b involved in lipid metabolism